MKNPAREKFLPLLSPYIDGELTPTERQQVENHLQNNKDSAAQVADFRAGDGLMRHALDMAGDDVDWKKFTEDVMSRVTPEKLPWLERLRITLGEMFTYQRGPLVAAMGGAVAAVAIAIPLTISLSGGSEGYGAGRVEVQAVSVDSEATVKPVVYETEGGDAVIWVVDAPEKKDGGGRRKGGSDEEDIAPTPPEALEKAPEKKDL
jgi:anti-sigma factor RsiW